MSRAMSRAMSRGGPGGAHQEVREAVPPELLIRRVNAHPSLSVRVSHLRHRHPGAPQMVEMVEMAQGGSSRRKWGTKHRVRKGDGEPWVSIVHPCRYGHRRTRKTKS
eukprot:8728486-Pyramimonas_sp.AAC.2